MRGETFPELGGEIGKTSKDELGIGGSEMSFSVFMISVLKSHCTCLAAANQ